MHEGSPNLPLASRTVVSFRTLGSSSSGNCSALLVERGSQRQAILIDLGFSPKRTRQLLALAGLADVPVVAVLLTHLDDDHMHPTWAGGWKRFFHPRTSMHLHKSHLGRARRAGFLEQRRVQLIGEPFEPLPGVVASHVVAEHDELGSCVFRFDVAATGRALGYATDLGRATEAITAHLAGVDVLAIESNYCPRLQLSSPRPEFLKRRIMDGRGHLSNEQCAEAIARVGPKGHAVLLHLSRQCNAPDLASAQHSGRSYALTVAKPDEPTPWIEVCDGLSVASAPPAVLTRAGVQGTLFSGTLA